LSRLSHKQQQDGPSLGATRGARRACWFQGKYSYPIDGSSAPFSAVPAPTRHHAPGKPAQMMGSENIWFNGIYPAKECEEHSSSRLIDHARPQLPPSDWTRSLRSSWCRLQFEIVFFHPARIAERRGFSSSPQKKVRRRTKWEISFIRLKRCRRHFSRSGAAARTRAHFCSVRRHPRRRQ